MFSRVRIAIRFFFVGLAVGVLLAPAAARRPVAWCVRRPTES